MKCGSDRKVIGGLARNDIALDSGAHGFVLFDREVHEPTLFRINCGNGVPRAGGDFGAADVLGWVGGYPTVDVCEAVEPADC